METHKKQKKTKSTKSTQPNDIATHTTTQTPDATAAPVLGATQPSGANATPAAVRTQGLKSIQLTVIYAVAFAARKYTAADIAELKAASASFDTAYEATTEARSASKQSTLAYRGIVQASVMFRDQLVAAERIISQGKPSLLNTPRLALTKTTRAKQLALWFHAMAEKVRENEAALTGVLGGDAVALLQANSAALDQAITERTVRQNGLTVSTEAQKAAQLRLVTAIARQRYVAELAFAGNKKLLKEFVPLWSLKRRAKKTTEPQPGAGGPQAATPGSTETAATPSETAAAQPAAHADAKAIN